LSIVITFGYMGVTVQLEVLATILRSIVFKQASNALFSKSCYQLCVYVSYSQTEQNETLQLKSLHL